VQVSEGHSNLDSVKTGTIFREPSHLSQVHEKLTTTDEPHDEEDFLLSLKDVAHSNEERMISL
jgi:hypothetical protein